MRKIFIALIVVTCLFGCTSNNNDNNIDSEIKQKTDTIQNDNDDIGLKYPEGYDNLELLIENEGKIVIKVKSGTLTNDGLTLLFINGTANQYTFGESYQLKQMINNEWQDVKPIIDNYGFLSIGYNLLPQEIKSKEINWKWLYGTLEPSEYSLVTDIIIGDVGYEQIDLVVNFIIE